MWKTLLQLDIPPSKTSERNELYLVETFIKEVPQTDTPLKKKNPKQKHRPLLSVLVALYNLMVRSCCSWNHLFMPWNMEKLN